MSVSAHLVCPARHLSLSLGTRLSRDGVVTDFSIGSAPSSEDPLAAAALWKFLADTAGEELVVKFSTDPEFETLATYPEIGGWVEDGDIPYEDYLGVRPTE